MSRSDSSPDHFSSQHLHEDLKGRTVRGGMVTVLAQGISLLLNFGSLAILARLLLPEAFGLVAMVTVIVGLLALFKDAGLSMATVQKAEITHQQISTLFWMNVGLSCLLGGAIMGLSPLVAWFYGEPRLVLITVALGGGFLISGLTVQHQALLRRQMRFGTLAGVQLLSMAVGIGAAIYAACLGLGYWALVIRELAMTLTSLIAVWAVMPWKPGLPRRGAGTRDMLGFGGYLSLTRIANFFFRNLDNILIGRQLGEEALGYYSRAYALLMLPISQLNTPVSAAVLPALCRKQDDPEGFRRAYIGGIGSLCTLGLPIVGLTVLLAEPVVLLLLGGQWMPVIPLFRALGIAAAIGTVNVAAEWIFIPFGRVREQFIAMLGHSAVVVPGMIVGLWLGGGLGLAWGVSLAMLIARVPYLAYAYRGSPVSLGDFWLAVRPAVCGVLAATGVGGGMLLLPVPDIWRWLAAGLSFLIVYAMWLLISREGNQRTRYIIGLIRSGHQPDPGV